TSRHRTSFVHHQSPPLEILAVAVVHGLLRRRVIVDFDKSETAGLAGEAITHDGHSIDRHAVISKETRQVLFVCRVGKVTDEKLLHASAPYCNWREAGGQTQGGRLRGSTGLRDQESGPGTPIRQ